MASYETIKVITGVPQCLLETLSPTYYKTHGGLCIIFMPKTPLRTNNILGNGLHGPLLFIYLFILNNQGDTLDTLSTLIKFCRNCEGG